jgi:hypothetical protein
MLGRDELARRLGFHPAGPATVPMYELNRAAALVLADLWDQLLPEGREKSTAQSTLQSALMWANAAVACNADPHTHEVPATELGPWLDELLERVEGPEMTRNGPDEGDTGLDRWRKRLEAAGEPYRDPTYGELAVEHRRALAELDADGIPEQTR